MPASQPPESPEEARSRIAGRISQIVQDRGLTVAVAESLTGGMIAQALAVSGGASSWFRGSLVAYSSDVKHDVLDVPPGPVVSAEAAGVMARNVRKLLGADIAVAATGAGGPGPQDGREAGTVFLAVAGEDVHRVLRLELDSDDPSVVCATTAEEALQMLLDDLQGT
ncbi:MAG TPA: CinA family protein [Pseudonocardia sp.]|nr:CinA family protein [Pseudonocardia sp.]